MTISSNFIPLKTLGTGTGAEAVGVAAAGVVVDPPNVDVVKGVLAPNGEGFLAGLPRPAKLNAGLGASAAVDVLGVVDVLAGVDVGGFKEKEGAEVVFAGSAGFAVLSEKEGIELAGAADAGVPSENEGVLVVGVGREKEGALVLVLGGREKAGRLLAGVLVAGWLAGVEEGAPNPKSGLGASAGLLTAGVEAG